MSLINLELGGGGQPISTRDESRKDFINMDAFAMPSVAIVHDATVFPWPFEDNSVTNIYSSEFIEHISYMDLPDLLNEAYRVLVPGGTFAFECPDAEGISQMLYEPPIATPEQIIYLKRGILGDQSRPYDFHKNLVSHLEMSILFDDTGFVNSNRYPAPTWRVDYKELTQKFGETFMQRVKLCMIATKPS